MRLNTAALALAALAAACSAGTGTTTPDAGSACSTGRDCPQTPPQACVDQGGPAKVCVPKCSKNADCPAPQVCTDLLCTNPGCGGDSDCSGGQICLAGNCTAPVQASAVGSCLVTPDPAVVHAGGKLPLAVVVRDLSGAAVPFKAVTWAAAGSGSIDAATGVVTGATPASGATGAINVTATAGGRTCTAVITSYAAASGHLRVVAIDAHSKRPVAGALVVMDGNIGGKQATDSNGMAAFSSTGAGAPHDFHVFKAGYNYASFIGATSADLLVPLPPYAPLPQRSGFSGTLTGADFARLATFGELLHVGLFGSGIANSILDFSLDTLLGPLRPVTISIGTTTTVALPSGLVLGLGDNLFGTEAYKMYAEPGKRVLWGLGGNVNATDAVGVLAPLFAGGTANIDIGAALPKLLPLLGNLEAGAIPGVEAPANVVAGGTPAFTASPVPLTTPMRLRASLTSPDLPKVDGQYLDGVIVLAGSAAYPMGFVPLGLTAGVAAKDGSGSRTGKILDPTCDTSVTPNSCVPNTLALKLAAQNSGLELNQYGMVLLALNFGGLSPGSTTGVAVSGLVKLQDKVAFTAGETPAPVIDYGSRAFPALPDTGVISFSQSQRKLVVGSDPDASTQIYRFELENAARQNWNVWMGRAGAGRTVTLLKPSDVDASLVDPMDPIPPPGSTTPQGPSGRIVAITTTSAGQTYAGLTGWGDVTLDNIGNNLSSFAVIAVTLGN